MIAFDTSISPSVWETSGEGLSVQLMNTALRAEKSYEELRHKFGCVGDNVMMRSFGCKVSATEFCDKKESFRRDICRTQIPHTLFAD
jgi:hypothetical protein